MKRTNFHKRKKISILRSSVIYCPYCFKQVGVKPNKVDKNTSYVSFACRDCGTKFRICSHCKNTSDMDTYFNDEELSEKMENVLYTKSDGNDALVDFQNLLESLDNEQREALEGLRDGFTYRELAEKMSVSHETVRNIIKSIKLTKLKIVV